MKFWDSSAVVTLLVEQSMTKPLTALLQSDSFCIVWWGTQIECVSAISRLEREGKLTSDSAADAITRLYTLSDVWSEVQPTPFIKETAIRFLRVHALRSADALQLAAAFIASENHPSSLDFVSLDNRLCRAAQKEGFKLPDLR